jgi:hypothetical protein
VQAICDAERTRPASAVHGLNRLLSGQLRSPLVSAAHPWLDTENGTALYSAADHLYSNILDWQPASMIQHGDITLIVSDVV